MHPNTGDSFTDLERSALAMGLARIHHGRVIPIIRGAEGEGGEGGEGGAGEGGQGGASGEGGQGDGFQAVTSQAQFDRMVGDRIARERAKFSDYDDLKAKAAKLAELEAADQTELEKAQTRAEQAEQRATQVEAEAKETRLRSAIIAEAAKPDRKVVDPEAVIALLDRTSLELDDAGVPTNIAQAMDSLLEARPYLVGQSGGTRGSADQGARSAAAAGQLTRDDLQRLSAEGKTAEIVKAQADGRLDEVLSGKS